METSYIITVMQGQIQKMNGATIHSASLDLISYIYTLPVYISVLFYHI